MLDDSSKVGPTKRKIKQQHAEGVQSVNRLNHLAAFKDVSVSFDPYGDTVVKRIYDTQ